MSRIELRRWLLLGLAAFGLRASAALLTERHPLFPSYYYHDAVFAEDIAAQMAVAWGQGLQYRSPYSPQQRAHAVFIALPYLVFGPRPLASKLLNAALGALSVVLLGLAFRAVVEPSRALAAAALVAAWPSHAFYTSQNFKEAPMFALAIGGLALLLPALGPGGKPAAPRAAAGAALLALSGLLRNHVMLVTCASLAAGAALALAKKASRRAGAMTLAAAVLAAALSVPVAGFFEEKVVPVPPGSPRTLPPMAPIDLHGAPQPPLWTPAGITHRRLERMGTDRAYAQKAQGREVGTQIYPDARFDTWLDVAAFMPRAAFTALFMPLPGLYPLEGKPGRWFAALENVLLLALSAAAVLGASRGARTPARAALLVFFLLMAAGSSLSDFDLGSAARHKLLYLPMLFPFALEALPAAWLRRKA